ncbi:MAG: restriction endonuclease subunit S [Acinetobacter amyesii]|uniref:restriction endonuclease subunit S n=1 Tax=Acinetobacter amyesii TaxID=2942470 RepID=UPI003D07AE8E
MAKYEVYAEYKDSGVEWLGKIPSSWQVKKLKYLSKVTTGSKDTVNAVEDGKYPFFVRSQTVERINSIGADCEAVLTAGDGVGVGKVYHYYKGKFDFHQRVYMLYDFGAVTGRFVYYYLSSNFYKVALEGNAKSTVDSLRLPQFLNFEFSVPTVAEQNYIVDFLDYETAKIDSLIEKQQQLIELLKEKRQAVISHAVTKGLDPNVPMKDSGVEWLGNVPEHWEISRLKHILDMPMRNGLFKKKDQFGSGSLLVNVTDLFVENNFINTDNLESVQTTFDERKAYKVNYGDLFFVRSSLKLEGIGRSACFLSYHDNAVFECHVVNARPNVKKISPKYLTRYLNSIAVIQEYIRRSKTTTMTTIDQNGISSINIVVPPKVEQINIDNYLDNQLEIFSDGEKKAKAIIDLLIERRTALISAAVTGKIDVRNWQNPNKNNKGNMELSA